MADGKVLQRYQPYAPGVPANYPGVAPTINQDALDALAVMANLKNARQVYVDASVGSDATGTGAQLRPFQTIEAAFANIALLPAGNYVIMLAPGAYGTGPIAWPVSAGTNISVQGSGDAAIVSPITYTAIGGLIEETIVFQDVGISDMTIDLAAAAAKVAQVLFYGCSINVNRVDSLPPGPQVVRVTDCFISSLSTNGTMIVVNGQWVGGAPNAIGATGNMLIQGGLAAAMVYNVAAGGQILLDGAIASFSTFNIDGTMSMIGCVCPGATIAGTGTLLTDATSLSFAPTVTISNVALADNAQYVGYTPTTPADWSAVPLNVKEALDTLAAGNSVPMQQVRFVAKNGSDVTGTGSIEAPYLTIGAALAAITDNADNKKYFVLVGPGIYTEPSIVLKPNVSIAAFGVQDESSQAVEIQSLLSLDASWSTGSAGTRTVLSGITFTTNAQTIDNTGISGTGAIMLKECDVNVAISFIDPFGTMAILGDRCTFFGVASFTGFAQVNGDFRFQSGGSFTSAPGVGSIWVISEGLIVGGALNVTVNPGESANFLLKNTQVIQNFGGSLVLVGTGGTLNVLYTVDSMPPAAALSNTGATLVPMNQAYALGYDPATPANWVTPPTEVAAALDELAARPSGVATTFVYQEGGTPGANVYDNWASLYAALSTVDGPKIVQIDDSVTSPCVIPAGTYDMSGVTLTANAAVFSGSPRLSLADLCVLDNLVAITGGLGVESQSTAPVLAYSNGQRKLEITDLAYVRGIVAGVPVIDISGTAIIGILLRDLASLGLKALNVTGTGQAQVLLFNQSNVQTDALESDATGTITVGHDATSQYSASQANWLNPQPFQRLDDAERVQYNPSTPANWPAPAPSQVRLSLDTIAGQVSSINTKLVYVDVVRGSDVTGTGSELRPFASITAAIAYVTGAGAGAYTLMLASGSYTEAPLAIPGNVSFQGAVGSTTIDIAMSYTAPAADNAAMSFFGVALAQTLVLDCTAAASGVFLFDNCSVNLQRTDTNPSVFLNIFDCGVGSLDISGAASVRDSLLTGNVTVQAASSLLVHSSTIAGGAYNVIGTITLLNTNSLVNVAGAGSVYFDAASVNLTNLSGGSITVATQNMLDRANVVGYDPDEPTDWVAPPTQVAAGLDELAQRVTDAGLLKVEQRTVTAPEAAAKQLTLAQTPITGGEVAGDLIGGVPLDNGGDFSVTGAVVDWTGLGLDGIVVAGTKLRFIYNYKP